MIKLILTFCLALAAMSPQARAQSSALPHWGYAVDWTEYCYSDSHRIHDGACNVQYVWCWDPFGTKVCCMARATGELLVGRGTVDADYCR